jgi:uncharacterized protein (DUF2249 family)
MTMSEFSFAVRLQGRNTWRVRIAKATTHENVKKQSHGDIECRCMALVVGLCLAVVRLVSTH